MRRERRKRVHDWRLLKWPFTVTFVCYALFALFTGASEAGEAGFIRLLVLVLLLDACLYALYCFVLSRERDDIHRLWAVFLLFYGFLMLPQLGTLWSLLKARAAV